MKLVRGNSPLLTDWVSAADISGSGTAVAYSVFIGVEVPLDHYNAVIEVEFDQQLTSETGQCWASVDFRLQENTGAVHASVPTLLSAREVAGSGLVTRRLSYESRYRLTSGSTTGGSPQAVYVRIAGAGSDVAANWAITNIRARIKYIPL